MNPQELTRRVLQELAAERAVYGYGSIAAIDRRMGKGSGYLGRVLRGEVGLQVETLFQALEALDADLVTFFGRVVGAEVSPERLLRRLERQGGGRDVPAVLDRCERLLAGGTADPGTPVPAAGEITAELARLDEERFSDPVETAKAEAAVEAAARRAARRRDPESLKLLARALGVLAPFYRLRARFAAAARCLRLALRLSAPADLLEVRADVLQRICYLLGDQGEYRVAAEVARLAFEAYALAEDGAGTGRALVDRAIMLNRAGQPAAAAEAYEHSLKHLPEEAWVNRFSVYQGLGWIHAGRGDLDAARHYAERAAACHRTRQGQNWSRLLWLQGEIAFAGGQPEVAQRALREARAGLVDHGNPFDVALVSLRLAKALFATGEVRQMQRLAAEMLCLLKPLGKHRIASAAVQEFARATLAGEVTLELLDRVFEQVKRGRPHAGAPEPSLA